MKYLTSTAEISPCQRYRYHLHRVWNEGRPKIAFIGLNPSTADANADDPTIRRCVAFANSWGYGGMFMVNLIPYRETSRAVMLRYVQFMGLRERMAMFRNNEHHLREVESRVRLAIAAWGADGAHHKDQVTKIHDIFQYGFAGTTNKLRCLKLTKDGHPGHPLYLKGDLQPISFSDNRFTGGL